MKKLFSGKLMSPADLREKKIFGRFGDAIFHETLWHFARKPVRRAAFLGLFFAVLPIPLQMLIVVAVAIRIHANLPVALSLVWVTNPITIAPITYFEYQFGKWLTNMMTSPSFGSPATWSPGELTNQIVNIVWPSVVGSVTLGIIVGTIAYFGVDFIWGWRIRRAWQLRKRARRAEA